MARTVEQIQADIEKVQADAAAESEIQGPDGRRVVNRPEGDRQKALAALRQELAAAEASAAAAPRTRRRLAYGGSEF